MQKALSILENFNNGRFHSSSVTRAFGSLMDNQRLKFLTCPEYGPPVYIYEHCFYHLRAALYGFPALIFRTQTLYMLI